MHKYLLIALTLILQIQIIAQTNISDIVNQYASVSAINFCASTLTVNDATGFSPGDVVLLIQMKGAVINQSNSASFGTITNWGSAGYFERSNIVSIDGNNISLSSWLLNNYDLSYPLQLVRVPVYENAIVTDTLRAKSWDGSTGGVIAFDVNSLLEVNAPIDASGSGFHGGLSISAANNNCSWLLNQDDYGYEAGNWRGAFKGEGIAIVSADNVAGRGPMANGGGGGNDHNSGGGGGGHIGQGGTGGENNEPANFGCDGSFPGIGGKALNPFNGERIFLGGGGGAGHSNNNVGSDGGNGGGIIFIKATSVGGSNAQILANGSGTVINNGQDGGGGGGAGGTICLFAENITDNLSLEANGFDGSQVNNQNANRCFGPGGGGAGGAIYANQLGVSSLLSAITNGGLAGITTNTTNNCNGSTLGAMPGANGLLSNSPVFPEGEGPVAPAGIVNQPVANTYCEGDMAFYSLTATGLDLTYQWEIDEGAGFMPLTEAAPYSGTQSNTLQVDNVTPGMDGAVFRCVLNSTCSDIVFSEPVTLTVEEAPVVFFDFSTDDLVVTFTNQSNLAGAFYWDFGDGNNSSEINPVHSYATEGIYYVSLLLETACGSSVFTDTVQLATLPMPGFEADVTGGCLPLTVQFTDQTQGFVEVYAWSFPGGDPASSSAQNPLVVYNQAGVFDVLLGVTNNAGSQSITYANLITVEEEPIAGFDYQTNGLNVIFSNFSQYATDYLWDFGDGSTIAVLEHPVHDFPVPGLYNVTLIAENNFCADSITIAIEVGTTSTTDLHTNSWQVFPNPLEANISIWSDDYQGDIKVQLFDITGGLLVDDTFAYEGLVVLETSGLAAGVYCLVVQTEKGQQQVFKLLRL